ncbi:luciferin 4-monooxygenase-like [Nymphalis io]|uniref:luciferin 4-monooxygenase-like n=1 Tax=Inachis io TaxID=171585 RepID=UPI00216A6DE2|nr:luciferin 4-monooxygenase-like [Nymphalis io]
MLKNKLYVYGSSEATSVPAHLHFGKHILNEFKPFADNDAIIDSKTNECIKYKELSQKIVDIALSLTHMGVRKGDVISICSVNVMEFMPVVFGAIAAGATFSPIDVSFGGSNTILIFYGNISLNILEGEDTIQLVTSIEKIIIFGDPIDEAIGFKDFLTQHASVEDFEATPVNGAEDLALILYSSGTTGMPKGIKVTHLNVLLVTNKDNEREIAGWRTLGISEWYNSFGLITTLHMLRRGTTVVYCNDGDIRKQLEVIQEYKINIIPTTPTHLIALLKLKDLAKYDTSTIKSVFVVDLKTREPLGPNQKGEICFKTPALMKGYIGVDYEYLDDEGFFKTGDIGYYDEDKYFYVVDRIKDLIKYNSYQVAPAELEALLQKHPAVREAGVVGAPHEDLQELPTAFVVLQPGAQATEQELVDFVDKYISHRMRLAGGVRFVDAIPRCNGIKVDRKKLRLMLAE